MAFVIDDVTLAVAGEMAEQSAEQAIEGIEETAGHSFSEGTDGLSRLSDMKPSGDFTPDKFVTEGEKKLSGIISDNSFSESLQDINLSDINLGDLKSSDFAPDVFKSNVDTESLNSENDMMTDLEQKSSSDTSESSSDGPRKIKTIRDDLAGQPHPETGVIYEEKTVVTDTGEEVIGVFPQFESAFDAQLPKDLYQASDVQQFKECNNQLKEAIEKDPSLKEKFTERQLEQINQGYTPEGYTWHHNEDIGKMQLVDSDIHANTRHTGGRSIWGGGTDNR